jgi:hypothetical protein
MRKFWTGVPIGLVIGAAGAAFYCELSSAPEEKLIKGHLLERVERMFASLRGLNRVGMRSVLTSVPDPRLGPVTIGHWQFCS